MSWTIDVDDLPDLARGAALLGTGGGGDPTIGMLLVKAAIEEHGPVTILDPSELDDDALVIPTAQMGHRRSCSSGSPPGRNPSARSGGSNSTWAGPRRRPCRSSAEASTR